MFGKFFTAALLALGTSVAAFAGDYASIDLNYWCRGNLKLLTEKLPEGVTVSARKNYSQKKFAHICFYKVNIDLSKAQEIALEFEVVDVGDKTDGAKLVPSVSPFRNPKDGKAAVVECLEFEFCDESTEGLPVKITKWKSMIPSGIIVKPGDKITLKAKFKASAE